ncbi:hypothetical protein [Epilithonimonas arachidiradicis]|uniref:Uncharacterized protein n=2 Tax=Epilithonimonas arachidiradicis TaxID=1617282 RepID=A0A420DAS4_9FLAO|nr:hypothetical protein [Epilithonimonas arachidiradicis]RKE88395.1 hypothetical protein BXY58_1546 [Epilithonimonas arachidiradicis]
MKTQLFPFFLLLILMSCDTKETGHKNIIISKAHYKPNSKIIDTLWVSQNDSIVFNQKEIMIGNPGQTPEPVTIYELKRPKDGVYYYIYDNEGKLFMEGRYDAQYTYEGHTTKQGDFYNSKTYRYRDNGKLRSVHYMEDGRNVKTELYNRKEQLDEVRYIDKKSETTTKVEIYENGEVKKTRVYTSFDNYYTVPGATKP